MPSIDYCRVYGGKRKSRKSPPLSMADMPSRDQLIQNNAYFRKPKEWARQVKRPKFQFTFCPRRAAEFYGLKTTISYAESPTLIIPRPDFIYEIKDLVSFTSSMEAAISGFCLNKQVLVHKRRPNV